MRDDTREELERLEKELLSVEEPEEFSDEEISFEKIMEEAASEDPEMLHGLLEDTLSEPAFEDPDVIHDPKEPLVYCNYSNDYGRDLKEFAENGGKVSMSKDDRISMGLMIAVSVLCAGIVGVLIYWLAAWRL